MPSVPDYLFKTLFTKEWITYAKRPFKEPQHILNYIGRYSHKIAITNHRIVKVSHDSVFFKYKNYRKDGQVQLMKLSQQEFVHRFARHIIPYKFVRIRHYGILSNRNKKEALRTARNALGVEPILRQEKSPALVLPENHYIHYCTCCQKVTLHLLIDVLPAIRGSPEIITHMKR
ncbi:MAG: transposase [Saprospiraceae bacterium]|nr:transposase [Saprospiraceae bacterium]